MIQTNNEVRMQCIYTSPASLLQREKENVFVLSLGMWKCKLRIFFKESYGEASTSFKICFDAVVP